jgi:hypothetical protein
MFNETRDKFIAAARADIPDLLAEVEALKDAWCSVTLRSGSDLAGPSLRAMIDARARELGIADD